MGIENIPDVFIMTAGDNQSIAMIAREVNGAWVTERRGKRGGVATTHRRRMHYIGK